MVSSKTEPSSQFWWPKQVRWQHNVYADLGRLDADEMQAKATLVTKISQAITARQLSNDQAAAALGLTLAELLAGRFRGHSVDDLERLAALLDEAGR